MNRYRFIKQLGDGTYGSVILATTLETEEKVAIKRMKKKFYSWEECLNLREVKSLRKLNHANIVKLKEVIRENDMLYFVFEYMKENLYQMTKDSKFLVGSGEDKMFPESSVRNVMYQVLQGLAFMHKHGFFHRDLKPENLLCSGPELVKIADFGLAREIRSRPPYTDYVSTRWYRAPEILLRSTSYSSPIDMWAVGTIMAEVYTLRPLFPGSSEIDQLFKITSVLGTPSKGEWSEGHKLAAAMNFKWPQMVATPLKQLIPNASADGIDFMRLTMLWDPQKRPSCAAALKHNFFKVGQSLTTKAASPRHTRPIASANPPMMEQPSYKPSYPSPMKALPQQSENVPPNPAPTFGGSTFGQQPKAKPQVKKDPFPAEPKKSGHRRRWGNTDDFDDDLDLSFSIKKKPPPQPKANFGYANKPFNQHAQAKDDDFEDILGNSYKKPAPLPHHQPKPVIKTYKDDDSDDDDWFSKQFGGGHGGAGKTTLPKLQTNNRINSGRSSASSAKQVYMSKSRYMPGKNPVGSAKKDSANKWSSQKRRQDGLGGMNINRTNAPLGKSTFSTSNNGSYVPSFGGSATKTNFNTGGWKRAEPAPVGLQKASANRQPVGATGRTDWASKYLK